MPSGMSRKATLADLAIVIAIVALGLASLRLTLASLPFSWFRRRRTDPGVFGAIDLYFEMALAHGVPLIALASLAVVTLSLRPPRPPLRHLARRAGFVLCLSIVIAALGTAAVLGSYHSRHGDPYPNSLVNVIAYGVVFNAGWAVLGSWLVLALAGHHGPVSSWLDRFGYGIAVLWFLLFIASCVNFVL